MDKRTIPRYLANQYVRIVDDCKFDQMTTIMWPDFSLQGPGYSVDSCEGFIDILEFLRRYSRTFHQLGSQFGEWEGEVYHGETYCVASHFYSEDGQERKLDMGIRYRETIEIREGQARYNTRHLNLVWTEDRPLGANSYS